MDEDTAYQGSHAIYPRSHCYLKYVFIACAHLFRICPGLQPPFTSSLWCPFVFTYCVCISFCKETQRTPLKGDACLPGWQWRGPLVGRGTWCSQLRLLFSRTNFSLDISYQLFPRPPPHLPPSYSQECCSLFLPSFLPPFLPSFLPSCLFTAVPAAYRSS